VPRQVSSTGAITLDSAPVRMERRIESEVPAGGHDVALIRIDGLHSVSDPDPLVRQH
jgi:flavin reductase (DIM6/NTAB) family NADH-FMN oxidoreductase RutF